MPQGGTRPLDFASSPNQTVPAGAIFDDGARGAVARIARLAIHDGPGIRTVVFLKGCPLHCSWCSSPETQRPEAELFFDAQRCARCGACLAECPLAAISWTADGAIHTDRSICDGCGLCIPVCPSGARQLVGQTVTVGHVLGEIEKDEVFYYRSGGGVTISGGEPLAQPAFTRALLQACAARGIHTAMETSACVPWAQMAPLLDDLRLIFVDVKHTDDDAHRKMTGMGNRLILDNIRNLVRLQGGPKVILRVPVVPGINDSPQNMEQTAEFARELQRIQRVELLPFHRFGLHNYAATGRRCEVATLMTPSDRHMRQLKTIFDCRGIAVRIGG